MTSPQTSLVDLSRVSVVLPAYNEVRTVASVLSLVPREIGQVILVAGNSTDGTEEAASQTERNFELLSRTRPGKGSALALGADAAAGDYVVMLDTDGSANPADIPKLIQELVTGKADFVKGFRCRKHRFAEVLRRVGNAVVTSQFNSMFGSSVNDVCCGYVAFSRDAVNSLGLVSAAKGSYSRLGDGFEIEALMLARALREGLVISQVEVDHRPRVAGAAKTRLARDGARIISALCAEQKDNFRRDPYAQPV